MPSESDIFPRYDLRVSPTHILTNNFIMSELTLAITSRKSTASGLDNISPVMLKHLPAIALDFLFAILNNIYSTQQIPSSWSTYKVIPIAKQNSKTSFRPIALSSALCKIFEHMLKTRLDGWLENNSILSDNLFSFRKGRGTDGMSLVLHRKYLPLL